MLAAGQIVSCVVESTFTTTHPTLFYCESVSIIGVRHPKPAYFASQN